MTSADGFPVIGEEISIQASGVFVGSEKLVKPAGVGRVEHARWQEDVVEVVYEGGKHYYYVSFNKFFTASEKMKFNNARDTAEKYRRELNDEDVDDRNYDDSSSSETSGWKIFFKILFFPFKAIWWLLKHLS